jgi:hypothetical protein
MNKPLHQKDDKMTPKGKSEFTEDIYFFEYIRERDRIPFTQMARIRMGKNVKFSVELDWLEKNYINTSHIMRQRNKKINDILDNERG